MINDKVLNNLCKRIKDLDKKYREGKKWGNFSLKLQSNYQGGGISTMTKEFNEVEVEKCSLKIE